MTTYETTFPVVIYSRENCTGNDGSALSRVGIKQRGINGQTQQKNKRFKTNADTQRLRLPEDAGQRTWG